MNLGILTFHYASNYGAVLQCYALSNYIERLGHEVEVLDYRPSRLYEHYRKWNWRRCGLLGQNVTNFMLNRKFDSFRRRHLKLGASSFCKATEVESISFAGDVVLCGSDQIWNPTLVGDAFDPVFFGIFGVQKRVPVVASIAASFGGLGSLENRHEERLRRLIDNVDYLSVREREAAEYLTQLTDRSVSVVPDPVFLREDYDSLIKTVPARSGRYILVFVLQESTRVLQIANHYKKHFGVEVVFANPSLGYLLRGEKCDYPSPERWLSLIKNAELVITNSFHATAFSILLQSNFVVVELEGRVSVRNARLHDLLDWTKLQDQFISVERNLDELPEAVVDGMAWRDANEAIASKREVMRNFISSVLNAAAKLN